LFIINSWYLIKTLVTQMHNCPLLDKSLPLCYVHRVCAELLAGLTAVCVKCLDLCGQKLLNDVTWTAVTSGRTSCRWWPNVLTRTRPSTLCRILPSVVGCYSLFKSVTSLVPKCRIMQCCMPNFIASNLRINTNCPQILFVCSRSTKNQFL
jgi:hypothetical protein